MLIFRTAFFYTISSTYEKILCSKSRIRTANWHGRVHLFVPCHLCGFFFLFQTVASKWNVQHPKSTQLPLLLWSFNSNWHLSSLFCYCSDCVPFLSPYFLLFCISECNTLVVCIICKLNTCISNQCLATKPLYSLLCSLAWYQVLSSSSLNTSLEF